jgi:hypothetical protein
VRMRLSASQVVARDNCARMHWYQSVAKIKPRFVSANFVFGRSLDRATRDYLIAIATGASLPDPVATFKSLWQRERQSTPIVYAATQTPEVFERMGSDLLRQLPGAWDQTGFQVALDHESRPLIDVRLSMELGSMHGVELAYDGVIDVMVYDRDGDLGVVDVKSSQASHTELYTRRSDQLTSYQMLIDANAELLGLPRLQKLGFWDFLKRKNSSVIEAPVMVARRSPLDISEYREKVFWMADDIRRRRFPKSSRMQFNTPCELCDFSKHCVDGDEEDLLFPSKDERASA